MHRHPLEEVGEPLGELAPFAVPIGQHDGPLVGPSDGMGERGERLTAMDERDRSGHSEADERPPVLLPLHEDDGTGGLSLVSELGPYLHELLETFAVGPAADHRSRLDPTA